ncbi:MAG TPA: PP2C family protein-serine/threonine phosphatase [Candidatus Acidoferrales bacterium]|nr:PP2C family protein-serine/threonine phosphatase [Candidatus Acidoferrales bacterium]
MSTNPSTSGGAKPSHAKGGVDRAAGKARAEWQRITEGIQVSDLWAQFQSEARSSYGLYAREVDWAEIGKRKRWQRPFHTAWALFQAMLMKLSPARRILMLLAMFLIVYPAPAVLLMTLDNELRAGAMEVKFVALGAIILFVLLALELADRVTMKRDLEIAREIQRWLVPEKPPEIPGYDIAFLSRPANTVAGDYYDTIPRSGPGGRAKREAGANSATSPEKLLLVVADVAGKSVPAAILMATFQASLRAIEAMGPLLETLVHDLNYYVCENSRSGLRFITAFFAELDTASGEITYTSAGHHPALLRRVAGQVIELKEGGLPLGIEVDERFPVGNSQLGEGEMLFIYTDGLVEAVNARGEEFSKARVEDLLFPCDKGYSAADVLTHMTRSLDNFVGAERQHDDITCMVVRRKAM